MPTKLEVIISPDELPAKFLEACELLNKLRYYKRIWEISYGSKNRNNLARWEEKADTFLKSLNLKPEEGAEETKTKIP